MPITGQHPDVYSTGHSSPLVSILENVRSSFSSNDFSLAQLDVDFDLAYGRIENVLHSVISGWFTETDKPHVVDKNRGWLRMAEMLNDLQEDWRILVCVRDLTQIYGSIEAQHAKTRFLNFADGTDAHGSMARADRLFDGGGVVGSPLGSAGGVGFYGGETGVGATLAIRGNENWAFGGSVATGGGKSTGKLQVRYEGF